MNEALNSRIDAQLSKPGRGEVADFARALAQDAGADAALFYGSNLRTGELDGVLDFYLLLPGPQVERVWPRVSYHERTIGGVTLRAKVATMALETFAQACRGESRDTTIWARFVQPSALVFAASDTARGAVKTALAQASRTAARLAVALGPQQGTAADYWRALFRATYRAELRVEKAGREDSILAVNADHFAGLLPLALDADGIAFEQNGDILHPQMSRARRAEVLRWWNTRRRWGKPMNVVRLLKASTTFEGAARYAAWKIERHTGVPVTITPWRERHPVLAAPGVLWRVWRQRER